MTEALIDHNAEELKFTETQPITKSRAANAYPWLRFWLKIITFMIICMVLVGGATRLTNSGLSITEWNPIMGAIPPWSAADWQTAFEKYQQSSQHRYEPWGVQIHFLVGMGTQVFGSLDWPAIYCAVDHGCSAPH
jgi:heme A synthase